MNWSLTSHRILLTRSDPQWFSIVSIPPGNDILHWSHSSCSIPLWVLLNKILSITRHLYIHIDHFVIYLFPISASINLYLNPQTKEILKKLYYFYWKSIYFFKSFLFNLFLFLCKFLFHSCLLFLFILWNT